MEVATENNNLANLNVAGCQLHSTLDFNESLKIILEIVLNLIGNEEFSIMMLDEVKRAFDRHPGSLAGS